MILEVILEAMFSIFFFIHYNQWGSEGWRDSTFLAPQIEEIPGSWDTVNASKIPNNDLGCIKNPVVNNEDLFHQQYGKVGKDEKGKSFIAKLRRVIPWFYFCDLNLVIPFLAYALGFVSLTRVRIQQTGCLVQSLRLLGFIHNTYDSYQLPNYVWNTAKIVLIARGKFGKVKSAGRIRIRCVLLPPKPHQLPSYHSGPCG